MCETEINLRYEALKEELYEIERPDLVLDLINIYYDTRKLQYNEGRKSVLTENTEKE